MGICKILDSLFHFTVYIFNWHHILQNLLTGQQVFNFSSKNLLFYECNSADAWPLVGVGAYLNNTNPIDLCNQMERQMLCGNVSYQPRMESVPVVLPLPPAPDYGSIFTTQKTGGAKSAF